MSSRLTTDVSLVEQEYVVLRDEILKRLEFRNQTLSVLLVVAGTFISVGTQPGISSTVLLVYPLLAVFLTSSWIHHGRVLVALAKYLREEVEEHHQEIGWEKYIDAQGRRRAEIGNFNNFAVAGLVLVTQALAIGLAFTKLSNTLMETILQWVSLVSISVTVIMIFFHVRPRKTR